MTANEYLRLRLQAGLTPDELAGRLGVPPGSIIDREEGRLDITPEDETKLRAVLSGHGGGVPGHWPTPEAVGDPQFTSVSSAR